MMNWIKLAGRNILRNKRRSIVTLAAIGCGFAAISLFYGYTSHTYDGLMSMAIHGEGLGHLTIYKKGWLEKGKIDPDAYMFSKQEIESIVKQVTGNGDVELATPQITLSGLVSNGNVSTIFVAQGVVPRDDGIIRGPRQIVGSHEGTGLDDDTPYRVEMARGLAKYLDLSLGKDAVVMAPTLSGQMNALDITVSSVFDTGSDATDDKYMRFSFAYAQSLLDTDKADRVVVLLKNTESTERMRTKISAQLDGAGIPCEIKTWKELSVFYSKVREMFDMIFLFIFCIVLVIVVMSTVNTMGMTVLERTREIGTLRALGLKRRGVSKLFALEGGLLGFFGSLLGWIFHTGVWALVKAFPPTYTPPGISTAVPLTISLVPHVLLWLTVCFVILSLLAAIIPARRAARRNVVAALGHT